MKMLSKEKSECYRPVRLSVEQCTAWMDVDNLRVDQRPITFLWIFLSRVTEEATKNCLLYSSCVLTTRNYIQFVPVKILTEQLEYNKMIVQREDISRHCDMDMLHFEQLHCNVQF